MEESVHLRNAAGAMAEIAGFRAMLAKGRKPVVVFVHPPKCIANEPNVSEPAVFSPGGKLLHLVRVDGEQFGEDNNYAPGGGFTPLALSLLASVLEKKGFESTILELSHSTNPKKALLAVRQILWESGRAIIWGFTATSPSNHSAMRLASLVKENGSLVFFGGSHATTSHGFAIRNCPQLDFIFVGEAEESLPKLLEFVVRGNGLLEEISGLTYRAQGAQGQGTEAGFHFGQNVRQRGQSLSFPYFEFLSHDRFPDIWGNERAFRIQGARGCKYRCSFCAQAIALQVSDIEKLTEYIVYLSGKSGSRKINIFFEDATFTSDKARTLRFCEKMRELRETPGISVSWGCQTRADCLDAEIISAIASAGCRYVYIGVESLNEQSLRFMRKSVNYLGFASPVERIVDTLRRLRAAKIMVGCSIIVGLPTDSVESFGFTLSKLVRLGVQMVFMESVKLFPMTRLSQSVSAGSGLGADEITSKYYGPIENGTSNPEDRNCYLMCEPSKLERFYLKAKEILSEGFRMDSEGLYVRKNSVFGVGLPAFGGVAANAPAKLFFSYRLVPAAPRKA